LENGEIQKNLAEMHWRQRRNSRNLEYQNLADFGKLSADFTDKAVIFLKFVVAISGWILPKIGKWKEKTVENNGMTSTKFVHANSP
jgi:hypothetical protein